MSTRTRSLQARLLLWGISLTLIGIVLAGLAIGWVLERFVVGQIDDRLDARTAAIADVLTDKGVAGISASLRTAFDPPFDHAHPGWFWQVLQKEAGGFQTVARSDHQDGLAEPAFAQLGQVDLLSAAGVSRPVDTSSQKGERVHARARSATKDGVIYLVVAAAPRSVVLAGLWQLIWPVSASILVLGIVLTLAIVVQVRWGLRPLGKLERDVADVRSGGLALLPGDQPLELASLVGELNQLIEHNNRGLEAARRQVANVAHGLKTPLATIQLELASESSETRNKLLPPVEQIEKSLRYHLNRARANAMSSSARERIDLAPAVIVLVDVLRKLFAERALRFSVDVDENLKVVGETRDLDEIIGNIVENACKWATSHVSISAWRDASHVHLVVEDDGPGVPNEQVGLALKPGERLDSQVRGDGFGLPIAQQLIELHGGAIELSRSSLGGLRVDLRFQGYGSSRDKV